MIKIETKYKILCRARNKKLYSYRRGQDDRLSVKSPSYLHYPIWGIITPKVGKLFVFNTIRDAEDFLVNSPRYGKYEIWEVQAINAQEIKNFPQINLKLFSSINDPMELNSFWEQFPKMIEWHSYPVDDDIPEGTSLCDALALVKRIA